MFYLTRYSCYNQSSHISQQLRILYTSFWKCYCNVLFISLIYLSKWIKQKSALFGQIVFFQFLQMQ